MWHPVIWWCVLCIGIAKSHAQGNARSGSCAVYTKDLCKDYLAGKQVFLSAGQSLERVNNQVKTWLDTAKRSSSISMSCWPHAKALLCYHMFPLCDAKGAPVQTMFCRDECRYLERNLCKQEFLLVRSIAVVRQYIPYCSDLPAHNADDSNRCQKLPTLNMTRRAPVLSADDHRGFQTRLGKRIALKCMFRVEGTPDFEVGDLKFHWQREGKHIKKSKERYRIKNRKKGSVGVVTTLVIKRVKMADIGVYNCSVSVGKATAESAATLLLRKEDVNEKKRITPKNVGNFGENAGEENEASAARKKDGMNVRGSFGKCSYYQGITCKKLLTHYNANIIFEYNHSPQQLVERKLQTELEALSGSKTIPKRCRDFGLAVICFNVFQACNPNLSEPVPRLCKSDCKQFEEVICKNEVAAARRHQSLSELLPDCQSLPDQNPYCVSLFEPRGKVTPVSTASPVVLGGMNETKSSDEYHCYRGKGEHYRGYTQVTRFGKRCRNWDHFLPYAAVKHNYCRNVGAQLSAPWCYVDNGKKELCKIPKCSYVAQRTVSQDTSSLIVYVVPSAVVLALCLCATTLVALYIKQRKKKAEKENSEEREITASLNDGVGQGDHLIRPVKETPTRMENIEIKVSQLKFVQKIRDGSFREVWQAQLMADTTPVNILLQRSRPEAPASLMREMQKEINLLRSLSNPNVVGLVCIVAPGEPRCMAYECDNIVTLKNHIVALRNPDMDEPSLIDSQMLLMDLGLQVCRGMEYLHYNHYTHRDVGTRSCLVNAEGVVKVACFGLGQYYHPEDYSWERRNSVPIALRWLSPEALTRRCYSIYDDTWSFGVLLWELFTFGHKPYTDQTDNEVRVLIGAGVRLHAPEGCPTQVSALMKECWDSTPEDRPSFSDIKDTIRRWATNV